MRLKLKSWFQSSKVDFHEMHAFPFEMHKTAHFHLNLGNWWLKATNANYLSIYIYIYIYIYISYLYSSSPQIFTSYQKHFTIFTCARPFSVSFLCDKEPPPPRSTPWGAHRYHGSCVHISASVQQPGETHNVSAFTLLHLLQSYYQVEVWWLGMFWQSTHVLLCAPIT